MSVMSSHKYLKKVSAKNLDDLAASLLLASRRFNKARYAFL
jgi:hypothetical protein